MLRDITIGQHFPGNSLVHRFDPRLKLVLTIVYIVLLFAASNPLGLALSILFLAATPAASQSAGMYAAVLASQLMSVGDLQLYDHLKC